MTTARLEQVNKFALPHVTVVSLDHCCKTIITSFCFSDFERVGKGRRCFFSYGTNEESMR